MSNVNADAPPPQKTPPGSMAPAIELIDLTKRFGTLTAVDHLSLIVEQGEIFGLLGPNGSGKTTTMNLVSGLSLPTSGTVRVLGYDVLLLTGTALRD